MIINLLLLLALLACVWYIYTGKRSSMVQDATDPQEYYTDDDAAELDRDDEDDLKRLEALQAIDHWTAQLDQYKALQQTHKAEIAAIRDYREKKLTVLPSLVEKPIEYMELASWLNENKRDYSEKREAIVQRALITDANNIYACQKRIAKARQILKGV